MNRVKQISEDQRLSGEAVARQMLIGATFDCFRCFGAILELFFHCGGRYPFYVALSSSDHIIVAEITGAARNPGTDTPTGEDERFRTQRTAVLPQLFNLIAAKVTAVSIDSTGEMSINLNRATIVVSGSSSVFETIWELTARSSENLVEPDCYVSLNDDGELSSSLPRPAAW